jgi:hypothetical protein
MEDDEFDDEEIQWKKKADETMQSFMTCVYYTCLLVPF